MEAGSSARPSLEEAKARVKRAENAWRKTRNAWLNSRGGEGEAEADRAYQTAGEVLGQARAAYQMLLTDPSRTLVRERITNRERDEIE